MRIRWHRKPAAARLVAGLIQVSERHDEEALADFDLALEENPKLEGAHGSAGRALFGLARYEDAIPHLSAEWQGHHDERIAAPSRRCREI
jgi:hypothetical protein